MLKKLNKKYDQEFENLLELKGFLEKNRNELHSLNEQDNLSDEEIKELRVLNSDITELKEFIKNEIRIEDNSGSMLIAQDVVNEIDIINKQLVSLNDSINNLSKQSEVNKEEETLDKAIVSGKKELTLKARGTKISSTSVTVVLTFLASLNLDRFEGTFLGNFLNLLPAESLSIIWLLSLISTIYIWIYLKLKENFENSILLTLDSKQRREDIFYNFIKYQSLDYGNEFNEKDLVHFIIRETYYTRSFTNHFSRLFFYYKRKPRFNTMFNIIEKTAEYMINDYESQEILQASINDYGFKNYRLKKVKKTPN